MNGNHRDRSRRAHARVVLDRFTELVPDLGQRIWFAAAGPEMDRLWPQLLRAWEWLKSMAASDNEAAAWLNQLLQGPTGRQIFETVSAKQHEESATVQHVTPRSRSKGSCDTRNQAAALPSPAMNSRRFMAIPPERTR